MIIFKEAVNLEVQRQFAINPLPSLLKTARETRIYFEVLLKVPKYHTFFPYKTKILHQTGDDDLDTRIEYCELMTNLIDAQPGTLKNICFTDESTSF